MSLSSLNHVTKLQQNRRIVFRTVRNPRVYDVHGLDVVRPHFCEHGLGLRRHLVRSLRHRHEANPDEQTGDIHLLGFDHQRSSTAGLTIFFDLRAVVEV